MEIRTFKDLDCWKAARKLKIEIAEMIKTFPRDEKYELISQIRRSSRSVTANIAEGYGRFHFQENIQYCRQARGSLYETQDHLITAFDEGYITNDSLNSYESQIDKVLKILNGYIGYLKRAKTNNN